MVKRIIVALIGIPAIIGILCFAPSIATFIFACVLSFLSAYELFQATLSKYHLNYCIRIIVCVTAVAVVTCLTYNFIYEMFLFLWVGVLLCFVIYIFGYENNKNDKFSMFAPIFMATLFIPFCFYFFVSLRTLTDGSYYVLIPLIICFMCDACAYFGGKMFGKHKMAPKVSPNKTWEGCIGGFIGGILGMVIYKLVLIGFSVQSLTWIQILILGLIGSLIAQIGDLCFSVIKREFGIKDYGWLLPGHGGVLDRFDSVIFVLPFVGCLMEYFV